MENNLITIRHLPELEERFEEKRQEVAAIVERCSAMEVTEENRKEVKKIRAELNKDAKFYEAMFKEIKEEVLAPWKAIEEAYKSSIKNQYKEADETLKEKIRAVENGLKAGREEEVKAYFEEYALAENVDAWAKWDRVGIDINLSDSIKKLKDEARDEIDRIAAGLALIDTQPKEWQDRILARFAKTLDAGAAITEVNAEMKAEQAAREIAAQRAAAEAAEVERQAEQTGEPAVYAGPAVPEPDEEIIEARFLVRATLPRMTALAKWLAAEGYDFESIN